MNINKKVTLQRIQTLTELHGAPGFEEEVKNYMTQQMAPYVDEFIENRMGGFFGVKKSKNPNAKRVMIAAHMDEIGFMITNITKNGMIQFTNLGGVANDIWQGQRLVIKNRNGDKIIGVVSNIPKHFRTGSEGAPEIKDLTLDIGAQNEDEVRERGIDIGDTIVPHTPFTQLSEHRYSAKAWDNRYGCVLAIEILELLKDIELDVDLYVGANVQEEVGLRGAKASAEMIDPDVAFVRDYLLKLVEAHDIEHQYYMSPGGTDGGEIHKANIGIPTAVIGVCARYIHSTDSVFDIRDYFAARSLLSEAICNLDNNQIETLQYK